LKSDLKLGKLNSEIKVGVNNHSYQLTFDKVSDLSTMLYIIAALYSLKYFNSPKLIFNSFPTDF